MTRLKELEPELEPSPEAIQIDRDVESSVKETVITGVPSQFVSDRNRDRPSTPTPLTSSPLREKKSLQMDSTIKPIVPPSLRSIVFYFY